MVKNCEICGSVAVDVWIDPRFPGQVLWVCREDLLDLTEIFETPTILNLTNKEDGSQ